MTSSGRRNTCRLRRCRIKCGSVAPATPDSRGIREWGLLVSTPAAAMPIPTKTMSLLGTSGRRDTKRRSATNFRQSAAFGSAYCPPGAEPWTLERAVNTALKNSPDARLARDEHTAALSMAERSAGGFDQADEVGVILPVPGQAQVVTRHLEAL